MPSAIILSVMAQYIKLLKNFNLPALLGNGKPYWSGRLSTVDLLIKIGCFVKKDSFSKKSSYFGPNDIRLFTAIIYEYS